MFSTLKGGKKDKREKNNRSEKRFEGFCTPCPFDDIKHTGPEWCPFDDTKHTGPEWGFQCFSNLIGFALNWLVCLLVKSVIFKSLQKYQSYPQILPDRMHSSKSDLMKFRVAFFRQT